MDNQLENISCVKQYHIFEIRYALAVKVASEVKGASDILAYIGSKNSIVNKLASYRWRCNGIALKSIELLVLYKKLDTINKKSQCESPIRYAVFSHFLEQQHFQTYKRHIIGKEEKIGSEQNYWSENSLFIDKGAVNTVDNMLHAEVQYVVSMVPTTNP